jgi:hypothetical protein
MMARTTDFCIVLNEQNILRTVKFSFTSKSLNVRTVGAFLFLVLLEK